ncbi:MAG TPA: enamine deaminase RidA [Pusillimonas sp.]|mgnify:CR=1 FL=1|nr:enamine deaminase RidA [Pusillimonas sp.]
MSASDRGVRQVVASSVLPTPRFLYTPVMQAGPFVFVSGMVAIDPETNAFIGGDVAQQTTRILLNLNRLLDEQGWSLNQLVLARIFCTDFSEFAQVNKAWDDFFSQVIPPARTSVGVSALPLGASVEIEFQLMCEGHPEAGIASS